MSDFILLSHPVFGVLGIILAVWVFVDALNANSGNAGRIRGIAYAVAILMVLAWIFGGYWYVSFYGADRAVILEGPLPWAHSLVMESKEHVFFITLVLAILLPIAARANLVANKSARMMVLVVSALVALSGLAIEGAGALISFSAKAALAQAGA
jgi:hypothetical protein